MPSRSDLFDACKAIAERAGIVTFWRGPFVPHEHGDVGADAYPVAGYVDNPDNSEQIDESGDGFGFILTGDVELWIWLFTGDTASEYGAPPTARKQLDDIHDALLNKVATAYDPDDPQGSILSNTMSLTPLEWQPNWFYDRSPHLGAALKLRYYLNYAAPTPR